MPSNRYTLRLMDSESQKLVCFPPRFYIKICCIDSFLKQTVYLGIFSFSAVNNNNNNEREEKAIMLLMASIKA